LSAEPNSYPHKTGFILTPEQIADGFIDLQAILNQSSWWNQSMIIGPDINRIYLKKSDAVLGRYKIL